VRFSSCSSSSSSGRSCSKQHSQQPQKDALLSPVLDQQEFPADAWQQQEGQQPQASHQPGSIAACRAQHACVLRPQPPQHVAVQAEVLVVGIQGHTASPHACCLLQLPADGPRCSSHAPSPTCCVLHTLLFALRRQGLQEVPLGQRVEEALRRRLSRKGHRAGEDVSSSAQQQQQHTPAIAAAADHSSKGPQHRSSASDVLSSAACKSCSVVCKDRQQPVLVCLTAACSVYGQRQLMIASDDS
jgi:hypothetical protein